MDKKWLILVCILLLNSVLVLYPAFTFDLPVTQTDGAGQYIYAKTFAEKGLTAENPQYNWLGTLERNISEYPPLALVLFGYITQFFGNDMFWINGGYAFIFLLLATIFVYLLFTELTGNHWVGVVGALFSALNFRIYYMALAGHIAFLTAYGLTFVALYYTLRYFKHSKLLDAIIAVILTALTYLAYTPQAFFLAILQVGLAIGLIATKSLKISLPNISVFYKNNSESIKKVVFFIIPTLIIGAILTKIYLLAAPGRDGNITSVISALLSPGDGYQKAWGYFFVTDGPLLIVFALIGMLYLLWKQDWLSLGLVLAGLTIVSINFFVIPSGVFARYLVYRFYTTFFILLALPASVLFVNGMQNKSSRGLIALLLVLTVLFNAGTTGYLLSKVEPALTQQEHDAALFLEQHKESTVLYLNNVGTGSSFRDFKWILVTAKVDVFEIAHSVPSAVSQDYIFVQDYSALDSSQKDLVDGYKTVFSSGVVVIKET